MEQSIIQTENEIRGKILHIRGMQVMLDNDLAGLYDVEVKRLNEQVRRNIERFPHHFMFQLTNEEFQSIRSHFATLKEKKGAHRKYLPYVFTEQGVAMLSGVLKSTTAVRISIQIMNAFVAMRRFIAENAELFHRLSAVERKQIVHDKKFDELFDAIQNKDIKPKKGIFFDGQVFDAYSFVSEIIRSANNSIILIDNYIDDSVLTLLSKRSASVQVTIFTREISKQLSLDLEKCNAQYPPIIMKEFKQAHDRFLIIDNSTVYHIGASLKDLGKKWVAFSRFDKGAVEMIGRLGFKQDVSG